MVFTINAHYELLIEEKYRKSMAHPYVISINNMRYLFRLAQSQLGVKEPYFFSGL